MSTIRVNTLQDVSGSNQSLVSDLSQGRTKAWVNFNGTGTIAIRDSYNVSSLTDHASGEHSINFAVALPSANYSVVGACGRGAGGAINSTFVGPAVANPTTTVCRIATLTASSGAGTDMEYVCAAFFGD